MFFEYVIGLKLYKYGQHMDTAIQKKSLTRNFLCVKIMGMNFKCFTL